MGSNSYDISEKYGKDRICPIVDKNSIDDFELLEDEIPDYPVTIFFTKEGYLKKITPQSLRMSSEQKLKNGDEIIQTISSTNNSDLLFFTDLGNVYKMNASEFNDTKASSMGEFVCAKFGAKENEKFIYMISTKDYNGFVMFFFKNGRVSKIDMNCYYTKVNRKRLANAYNMKFELSKIFYIEKDENFIMYSSSGKALVFNTSLLSTKSTRDSQGIIVMKLGKFCVNDVKLCDEKFPEKYVTKKLPSSGEKITSKLTGEQLLFE